jgi:catechol-2,3-dioxygenase
LNLNHLHLHVRNRSAAEQFYGGWFNLVVSRRGEVLTFLQDEGGFELALMDDAAPQPLPAWFHFGFHLPAAHAVLTLHEQMAAAGIPIIRPLYQDDTLVAYRCADPDGYGIEVYWEAPGTALD